MASPANTYKIQLTRPQIKLLRQLCPTDEPEFRRAFTSRVKFEILVVYVFAHLDTIKDGLWKDLCYADDEDLNARVLWNKMVRRQLKGARA